MMPSPFALISWFRGGVVYLQLIVYVYTAKTDGILISNKKNVNALWKGDSTFLQQGLQSGREIPGWKAGRPWKGCSGLSDFCHFGQAPILLHMQKGRHFESPFFISFHAGSSSG
jgi:hypothetical protein